MEKEILDFFKSTKEYFHSLNKLCDRFNLNEEDLVKYLNEMELNGIIYKNEDNEYSYMPKNYIVAEILSTKKNNMFIELDSGKRLFIDKENVNGALPFDTVVVEIGEDKGSVKNILNRKNPNVVCEIRNFHGVKNLVAYNIPTNMKLSICKNEIENFVEGDRIVVKVEGKNENGSYNTTLVKHLCHKDDPDKDIKTIATSKDIDIDFSEEAIEEAKKTPKFVSEGEIKGRVDLRNTLIFTIDGPNTKDIDDAISLEILPNGNYKLGVHIAHVSNYVKMGTAMFKDAYSRGTSVYMLDSVIPMIHHLLSNGICSLNEGEDRLTRSCFMEIDKDGKVVDYSICKSVINSKKKMTYDDVNKILEENIIPEGYEQFADTIKNMGQLSNILTHKRATQGALEFANTELKIKLNEEGKATEFSLEMHGLAEKLIENFMISANETVAAYVFWQNLPFVYRDHACPSEKALNSKIEFINDLGYKINKVKDASNPKLVQIILNQLSKYDEFPILSTMMLESMKRAIYDSNNLGHFGLASDCYTHFTSPIRRFPDLMVHMLLDEYEKIYSKNYSESNLRKYLTEIEMFLKEACKHSSYKERQADAAEEEANKFKMMEYMEDYVGQEFEGIITMISEHEVKIKTDNFITGKVLIEDIGNDIYTFKPDKFKLVGQNTKEQFKIGHKVSLTVKEVCRNNKEIYFYINENLTNCKKLQLKKDISN